MEVKSEAKNLESGRKVVNITSLSHFEETVYRSEKPTIIDFWASWCMPCRMIGPIFEELAQVYGEEMNFVKVNTQERADVAQLFGIRSIPTIVVMKGEEVKDVHIGAAPKNVIERLIRRAVDKEKKQGFTDRLKSIFGVQAVRSEVN
ncbi:MAG: hypothetical protein Kow0090_15310 [Myxococcota bacterium]